MKMKIWDLTITTFALSIVCIIVSAYVLGENYFDFNIWIALLIYTIPALILSYANGFTLISFEKLTENIIVKFGIGLIPILVLVGFLLWSNGPLEYIAKFGLIPIFITNLIWIIKNYKFNKKASV
tara:strand:+ start:614 stop:988 length:375 start_codon:yes stop_codon:yes gene_type:complete